MTTLKPSELTLRRAVGVAALVSLVVYSLAIAATRVAPQLVQLHSDGFFLLAFAASVGFGVMSTIWLAHLDVTRQASATRRFAVGVGLAAYCLGATIAFLFGADYSNRNLRIRCAEQVEAINQQVLPLIARLRNCSVIQDANGAGAMLRRPFVVVRANLDNQDRPITTEATLIEGWQTRGLGQLGVELASSPLPQVPAITPLTIVVIAAAFRQDGTIQLDSGRIPAFREHAIAFVLDVEDLACRWRSELVKGPSPSRPSAGPGIRYYSSIAGESLSWRDLDSVLQKIPWSD